jgi:3D (Asp-Asp-Asp) domain-containing protein
VPNLDEIYRILSPEPTGPQRACGTVTPVLGQAHTPRRRFLPFAAVALVVLAAPTLGLAGSTRSGPQVSATDRHAELNRQNVVIAAKSRAAVLELYSIDERLGAARTRLAALEQETATLRAERASLAQQLDVARRGSLIAQRSLAERLRLLYEEGSVEPLEIVFGSRSLDEAITSIDNLSRASGQSEDVLRELRAARTALRSAADRLASRQAALVRATRRAAATAQALAGAQAARRSYVASLTATRRLNDSQIASLLARSRAAQRRSATLARTTSATAASLTSAVPAAAALAAPVAAGRSITVAATGYALSGATSTGLPTGWGVVAVDPSVIPLGTHMTIPGYGDAVAADTGGSVVGTTIDLWFPSTAQANAWGRRTVTIVLH